MSIVYGANAALIASNPPQKAGVGEQGGNVKLIYDKYSYTADLGTDTIYMGGKIPINARIIDVMLKFPDLGSAGVADVGWAASDDGAEAGDQDGFMSAVDVNTAADTIKASDNLANAPGIGKKFAAACQPIVTLTTGTTATSGDVEIFIMYVVD